MEADPKSKKPRAMVLLLSQKWDAAEDFYTRDRGKIDELIELYIATDNWKRALKYVADSTTVY